MVKELEVVNIIPRILSIGEIAKELFKEINKISDNEIILNFKGVEYMCVSFAQEYGHQKNYLRKKLLKQILVKKMKIYLIYLKICIYTDLI